MKIQISSEKLYIFSYFIATILIGAALLLLPGAWHGNKPLSPLDALFTSTSAVCVTGLITVDTALYSLFGKAVILALIQFGGLGIITFTTIYIMLPRKRISLMNRGMVKEFSIDEVDSEPRKIVRNIVFVTFVVESFGAFFLYAVFRGQGVSHPGFTAIFHAVSAFCNAGFSTFSNNLQGYVSNPVVTLTIAALLFVGGLGFIVCEDIARKILGIKRRLSYYSITVLIATLTLVGVGFLFYLAAEWNVAYKSLAPTHKLLAAIFQSLTPRTAGFDTVPQSNLSPISVLFTGFLMFIGGSSGSTAGGIKTSTAFILFMLALRGTDRSNGTLVIRRRAVSNETIIKATQILLKAFGLVAFSILCVSFFERPQIAAGKISLAQIFFECISAFGTVGLSLGITAQLSAVSKIIIIATMFAGRVGLVAMALPAPGKRLEQLVDFASADHIVG